MTRASLVIPTRDKTAQLRLVLRCLSAQPAPGDFEVLVVDDGSTEGTATTARSSAGDLDLRVVPGPRRGRAAARNAGAAQAAAPILVFLDDDILVPPSFVASHVAAQSAELDSMVILPVGPLPDAGARVVHGPLRELPRSAALIAAAPGQPHAAAQRGDFGRTVANSLERMALGMAAGEVPPVAPWLGCVGANVSMPRELWREAGGFDEGFGTVWGCEDLEFGYRLLGSGAGMCLAPGASGVHLSHARPGRWEEHATNLRYFVELHDDPCVAALPALLSGAGTVDGYLAAVRGSHDALTPAGSDRPVT